MPEKLLKAVEIPGIFALGLAVVLGLGLNAPAVADEAQPNLKGTWIGETLGISLGDVGRRLDVNDDTKPQLLHLPIEMIIDFQDGRAVAGIKKHKFGNDRFVAVLRAGNLVLHGTDAEGNMDLTLLPNGDLESCYAEFNAQRAFASCGTFHKVP